MSSCLRKDSEGSVSALATGIEDGINDTVHALHTKKAHHGSRSPAHFHEASFDDIGCSQFLQRCRGKPKKVSSSGKSFAQERDGKPAGPTGVNGRGQGSHLGSAARVDKTGPGQCHEEREEQEIDPLGRPHPGGTVITARSALARTKPAAHEGSVTLSAASES